MTIPADLADTQEYASDTEWEDLPGDIPQPEPPPEQETAGESRFRGIVADTSLADFVKKPKTATAREYEKKTAGALNSVFKGMAQSPGTVIDAATILTYGDALSAAAGDLASESDGAKKVIDFLTAPDNPAIAFVMVAIPCALQLLRNHEEGLAKLPEVKTKNFTLKVWRKKIPLKLGFKFGLSKRLRGQTVEPRSLMAVFAHPDVEKALKRRGIKVASPPNR